MRRDRTDFGALSRARHVIEPRIGGRFGMFRWPNICGYQRKGQHNSSENTQWLQKPNVQFQTA